MTSRHQFSLLSFFAAITVVAVLCAGGVACYHAGAQSMVRDFEPHPIAPMPNNSPLYDEQAAGDGELPPDQGSFASSRISVR